MNRSFLASTIVAVLVAVAACGGDAPPAKAPAPRPVASPPLPARVATTPDAPFRQNPPAPDGKITFAAPKIQEAKLKNGVRVLLVERHDLPIVSVRVGVSLGAGDVPDARPGLVSFMGAMLDQGTKKRTALQISDDMEALGATHGAEFDWDDGGVALHVLADRLDGGLEIMSDIALAPTFPEAEIERLRARRIAGLQAEKSSPPSVAQKTIAASLYGRAHPYGHSIVGDEDDLKKVTRADLVRTYDRLMTPQNAAIVVAGDVTLASVVPKLETAFGAWKAKPGAATRKMPAPPKKPVTGKRVVFVERGGAQSQVWLVKSGVAHSTKDREAIQVANTILGGMFSSRVNMNLREKNAYTYGAHSHFDMRHGAGPFEVGGAIHAAKTAPAIKEILSEIESLRREGPSENELALAKESILLAMPARFETTSELTGALADLVTYDMPLDEFAKKPARIDAVTAIDVKRVFDDMLDPQSLTIVVVGDRKTTFPQLEGLGYGAPEERDPSGVVVDAQASKHDVK